MQFNFFQGDWPLFHTYVEISHTFVEKLKIFIHGEVYIKLFKEQKPGNWKNICIYFERGTLKKKTKSLKLSRNRC